MIRLISREWPFLATAFFVSALISGMLAFLLVKLGWCAPTRTGGKMPLTGGIGILLGFLIGSLAIVMRIHTDNVLIIIVYLVYLLPIVLPYFILGFIDDIVHFRPLPKFIGFVLIALLHFSILQWLGKSEANFSLFNNILLVSALFFFSNSYNFLDNADGHCATAFLGLVFALPFFAGSTEYMPHLCRVAAAAVLGFLVWNYPFKPKLYLGDAGSLLLGSGAVALIYISFLFDERFVLNKLCYSVLLLAFPLYDTCAVMLLRVLRGQNPTIGGQDHYSHRLMRGGFPLWLVNLIAFTAAGVLPVIVLKLPSQTVFFGPFVIWAFLLFLDVLAASLAKRAGNSSEAA
jgi:UDP-GlcNAc:undecaprenyl-phosphate GlcNAc-1-phosphate transferase